VSWSAIIAALLLCAGVGAIQGTLVARLRMPSFIVTLGGLLILEGVAIIILGGSGLVGEFAAAGCLMARCKVRHRLVEVALIQQRTNDINATIASVATANNAILIDIHAIFDDIKLHGYKVGGIGPFGQKRRVPTALDETAELYDRIGRMAISTAYMCFRRASELVYSCMMARARSR